MRLPDLDALRESHLAATLPRWGTTEFFFTEHRDLVQARVPTIDGDLLIARAVDADAARLISLLRRVGPLYRASIENLLSMLHGASELAADEASRALESPWHDPYTRWAWGGWDPATGTTRAKPGTEWRDSWLSPTQGAPAGGSRHIEIPRGLLAVVDPGDWRRVAIGASRHGHRIVGSHGNVIADFRRWEDAEFTLQARESALAAGPVYAALTALAASGEPLDRTRVDSVIDSTSPWTPAVTAAAARRQR
jgi:hypothetical protein